MRPSTRWDLILCRAPEGAARMSMTAASVSASMRRGGGIGPFVSLQPSHHNCVVMKSIHLIGAAAISAVLALTAPSWISPATAQGAQAKMSELPSGLRYTDSKVGDGAAATAGRKVSVHYTGWLRTKAQKAHKFN